MAPNRSSRTQSMVVAAAAADSEAESSSTTTTYLSGWRLGLVILSLFLASFLIALDTNIINTAIPRITSDFHALNDGAWYGTAYLVTLTALQPLYGTLYKHFDKANVYRVSIVVFEVGSVLCAAATSSGMFIGGRAVAGFGAAGVLQGALSIISQVVPLEKRPMYMGIVISVFAITVCVGPPLGGVFTQHTTWRWCFWINLPLGAVVMVMLALFLRLRKVADRTLSVRQKLARMDPLGCVVFIGAVVCLLLAMQWGGQTKPWSSPTVVGLFVGFGLLLAAFVGVQWWRGEHALIPLRVLCKRNIVATALMLFCVGGSTYLKTFYLPFYFQAVRGESPTQSGVSFMAFMLPQIVTIVVTGALLRLWGFYMVYMLVGELVATIATAFLTQLKPGTSTAHWVLLLVVAGGGMGAATQLPFTVVNLTLDDDDIPTGNAIAVLFQQLGGAIAISIGQTIELTTILEELPQRLPGLPPREVFAAGASGLKQVATSPEALAVVRGVWNTAVDRTMMVSVALVAGTVPFTLLMQWMDVNAVAKAKDEGLAESNSTRDLLRAAEKGGLGSLPGASSATVHSLDSESKSPPPSRDGETLKWQWVDGEWVL